MLKEIIVFLIAVTLGVAVPYFVTKFFFTEDPKQYIIQQKEKKYITSDYEINKNCIRFVTYDKQDSITICGDYSITEKTN